MKFVLVNVGFVVMMFCFLIVKCVRCGFGLNVFLGVGLFVCGIFNSFVVICWSEVWIC